jgi:hypothetical protein
MSLILNYSRLLTNVKSLYKSNAFATTPLVSELPLQMHHEEGVIKDQPFRKLLASFPAHNLSIIHFLHQQKYREKYKMKKS